MKIKQNYGVKNIKMKNAYAKQLQIKKDAREYIIKQWTMQLALDTMSIVLSDGDVMKDPLGKGRLKRVGDAFNRVISKSLIALTNAQDADYYRDTIDRRLKQIFGDDALPWYMRYEGWRENI